MKWPRFSLLGVIAVAAMLLLLAMPVSAEGGGEELHVGPDKAYSSIQKAVDEAESGSKILVYPGEYVESVQVGTDSLEILAQDSGVKVTSPDEGACFDVKADHVVIRGFDLTGPLYASGIRFEGSHNVFLDNKIHDLSGTDVSAVACMDGDGGSNHNKIVNNTISQAWKGIVIQAGSDKTPDAVNKRNVIRGNVISEVIDAPIAVENGIGFWVAGNQITGVADGEGHCLMIGAGELNTATQGHHRVVRNQLVDCGLNGIEVYTSDATLEGNRVAGNDISSAGGCGIHLEGGPEAPVRRTLVRGNHAYENKGGGICLGAEVNRNRVFGNRAWGNEGNGILIEGDHNGIFWNGAFENDGSDLKDTGTDNRWRRNRHGTDNW